MTVQSTTPQRSPSANPKIADYLRKSYDKSADGLLTAEELKVSGDTFKRLDANANGFVDSVELSAAVAKVDPDRQASFASTLQKRENYQKNSIAMGISGGVGLVSGLSFVATAFLGTIPAVLSGVGMLGGLGAAAFFGLKGGFKMGGTGLGLFGKDELPAMVNDFFKAS